MDGVERVDHMTLPTQEAAMSYRERFCWALVGAVVTLGCALVVVVALVGTEAVDVWLR